MGRETLKEIPINRIILPSWGDLRAYRDKAFESRLMEDLTKEGVLEPPIVRPSRSTADCFECLEGWSRVVSWHKLGHDSIMCRVVEADDVVALVMSLKLNIMRKSHDAIGIAKSFKLLHDKFGMRYRDIAERFGYSRSHTYKLVSLLKLPQQIQDKVASGEIPIRDAIEMVSQGGAGDVLRPLRDKTCDFCRRSFEAYEVDSVLLCHGCARLLSNLLEKREKALREELEREARRRKQRQARLSS